jgi:hypothetical protein
MEQGDGKEAIFWAKKYDEYWTKNKHYSSGAFATDPVVGFAYELNDENEKALEAYLDYYDKTKRLTGSPYTRNGDINWEYSLRRDDVSLNLPRILYKLGRKQESFKFYCRYGKRILESWKVGLENNERNEQNRTLEQIRSPIIMDQNYYMMRLTPFLEYKEFLMFMEIEYKNLNSLPEYEEAMQLFRFVQNEIDEKLVRHSDKLDALREKIRTERKQGTNK